MSRRPHPRRSTSLGPPPSMCPTPSRGPSFVEVHQEVLVRRCHHDVFDSADGVPPGAGRRRLRPGDPIGPGTGGLRHGEDQDATGVHAREQQRRGPHRHDQEEVAGPGSPRRAGTAKRVVPARSGVGRAQKPAAGRAGGLGADRSSSWQSNCASSDQSRCGVRPGPFGARPRSSSPSTWRSIGGRFDTASGRWHSGPTGRCRRPRSTPPRRTPGGRSDATARATTACPGAAVISSSAPTSSPTWPVSNSSPRSVGSPTSSTPWRWCAVRSSPGSAGRIGPCSTEPSPRSSLSWSTPRCGRQSSSSLRGAPARRSASCDGPFSPAPTTSGCYRSLLRAAAAQGNRVGLRSTLTQLLALAGERGLSRRPG